MINYGLTINSVSYDCEVGAIVIKDGTEQFDSGTLVIRNTTLSTLFTEADDVVLTVGTKTFSLIIQADKLERVSATKYDHIVTLTEETAKLTKSYSVDRFFTLNGANLFTHNEILDRVNSTTPLGKTPLYTLATATATALGTNSPQKKFEGLNQFQIATDCMRGINAVARLSNGVMTHDYYNSKNNPITLSNVIGWQKDNDLNNYATTIISNVKNLTYDADLTTGATWFPSKSEGCKPRSSSGKYTDDKAQYQLGLDIRRMIKVELVDVEISGSRFIDMDITAYVVSKELWDGLELGSTTAATLYTEIAQRNTLYYKVGDNVIENMGTSYTTNLLATGYAIEMVIKSWLFNSSTYSITDYVSTSFVDIKLRANYQPYLDATISSEKWDIGVTKRSEILNNQKDTIIDIGRYGEVLNSIANRLSNGNWLIKLKHSDETSLLELNDYTSDNYKVIKAKYEFYPNEIIGTYELSKDWTSLDGYQTIYKSTDPYSIGRDNVDANFKYTEYLEFSTTNKADTGSLSVDGRTTMMNMFDYNSANDLPIHTSRLNTSEQTYNIMMDTIGTGSRGLRFSMKLKEPNNAGNELILDTTPTPDVNTNGAVPIGDENGYMEYFDLLMFNDFTTAGIETTYPKITGLTATTLVDLPNLYVYKNPNEVFGFTYELLPCTDEEGIVVGSAFSELNNLVNDGDPGAFSVRVLSAVSTTVYTIFDDDTIVESGAVNTTLTSAMISKGTGVINVSTVPNTDTRTWLIRRNSDGRVIFAVNYNGTTRNIIYINDLKERSTTELL